MASFIEGDSEQVKSGEAQFRKGAIVSKQQATFVGAEYSKVDVEQPDGSTRTINQPRGGTKIYHRVVTYVTQAEDGTVSGAERVIYIEKNGKFQPAAISKDGGKNYSFSDPNYPTMDGVAGAGFKNELNDSDGGIRKNLDKQTNDSLDAAGIPKTQKKNVIESIKNNADQVDVEDTSDDATPLTDDQQIDAATSPSALVSLKIGEKEGTRSASGSFGNHVYPLDLGVTGQDVLKFTMVKYVPSDIDMKSGFGINTDERNSGEREILGTVILPIPGGISDNNQVSWGSQSMNNIEVAAAQFALNTISAGREGAELATKNIVAAVGGSNNDLKTAVGVAIAGQAAGVGGQLLTRTTGAVFNPNMELLFSGPSLRQFSFKFTFTARESAESKEIVKILRFFKQGSAVQRSESNLFLKSPHTFKIQYLYRGPAGGENPFMGKIKECACTGVNVNYTPQNNYSTFSDGAMTSYEMSLNFNELEPVFNDEYANDGDTSIGF